MLPLTGVKVIELAYNVAGPYAGFILAMLGADVLKIERPEGGDDARGWGPPFWKGASSTFQALNINKRAITLDLKDPAHVAWLKDKIKDTDVVVQNLRPGVLEELGLGARALTGLNPRLVYCSLSAFGHKGPRQSLPGYEPMVQAFAGLFSINGEADRPGVRIGVPVLDQGSGLWAALGCFAGLLQRERTGRGCVVDTSLFETAFGLMTVPFAGFQASGKLPVRHPTGSNRVVIFQALDTADGRAIVSAANDRLFEKFVRELGHPEWAQDARFRTNADRVANKDVLIGLVSEIMRSRTTDEWVARLEKIGVPIAPINDLSEIRAHPHTAALGILQPIPGIDLELVTLPLSFDGNRPAVKSPAPTLGQHNADFADLPASAASPPRR
ncbi:MAG TPA: CoA transferase [Hyphomicrobiaceae bacterium]|jgi:crotonobetainyl-CoA:carnitine CoA-transferase CaiB-like acyl-CoA transferase|nr:CoA transferase [Hyphomicrobiaceae bacterium]